MKIDKLQNKNISVRYCIGIIQNQEPIVIYSKDRNYFNLLKRNQMNDRNGRDDRKGVGERENHSFVTVIIFYCDYLIRDIVSWCLMVNSRHECV